MLDCPIFHPRERAYMPEAAQFSERDSQIVKKFCNSYFWMLVLRRYFKELFERNGQKPLPIMKRAAHFFVDLSNLLVDHFLLQAAPVL
jgi:hypothetical protein